MHQYQNQLGQPIGAPLTVTLPRPRPSPAKLQGRFCSVVQTDPVGHAPALFEAFQADREHRLWTYLPYGPFADLDAFRGWITGACADADPLFQTILDPTGQPMGLASYLRIDPAAGVIEVGHINLAPALQRTSAATEAMFLMMAHVFDTLGYRRYEWKCDALNAPSRSAALRLGFSYEGIFRKATHYKGRNRDTAWFSVVDDEWPTLRDAFARWLSPDNVDDQGRQKRSLASLRATGPSDRITSAESLGH
ncbi:MAG: GNAT family protein [Betaproteobacteria bacterium]